MSSFCILGDTSEEIQAIADELQASGFSFTPGSIYDSFKPAEKRFALWLYDFRLPVTPTPRPRPWDAVLGGKGGK
ncbi:MAG: hypothetical protein ACRCZS_21035 [Chroococcidiopsis sp.]